MGMTLVVQIEMHRREVDNGGESPRGVRPPSAPSGESPPEQFGSNVRRSGDATDRVPFFLSGWARGGGGCGRDAKLQRRAIPHASIGVGQQEGWLGDLLSPEDSGKGMRRHRFFLGKMLIFRCTSDIDLRSIIAPISEPKLPDVGPSCGQSLGGLAKHLGGDWPRVARLFSFLVGRLQANDGMSALASFQLGFERFKAHIRSRGNRRGRECSMGAIRWV